MICILIVSKMLLQNGSNRKLYKIKQKNVLSGLAIFDVNKYILMAAPRCLQIPIEIGNQWTLAPKITYEIVVLYNSTRKNTRNHTIIFMSVKQLYGKKFTR